MQGPNEGDGQGEKRGIVRLGTAADVDGGAGLVSSEEKFPLPVVCHEPATVGCERRPASAELPRTASMREQMDEQVERV